MSLIADALKTAQREKQRRESSARRSVSPLLVPLTAKSPADSGWRRALTIGVSGIVTVIAMVVLVQRMKQPAPLATLPPVPSPLAGTPLLAQRPTNQQAGRTPLSSSVPSRAAIPQSDVARVPSVESPALDTTAVVQVAGDLSSVARDAERPDAAARLQGEVKVEGSAPPPRLPPTAARSAGRLRIAVETPRSTEVAQLFANALAAHRAGELTFARALYERVLLLAPNDADALNNLGVLLSRQREFDRALVLLRRAASIAPQSAGIWNNIGAALREQGQGAEAMVAFRQALTVDPQHQAAKVGLAQQHLSNGSASQALELLQDVLKANPGLAEAHYAMGQALELQGDRVGAIRSFSTFMRLAPPRLAAHVERVRKHVDDLGTSADGQNPAPRTP